MRTIPIFSDLMDATGYDFDDEFLELFQKCKVPESIRQILSDEHFTSSALFALQDDDVLEECIQCVGTLHDDPPDWNTSVEASSIRHLHHCCWKASRAEDSQPKKPEELQEKGKKRQKMEGIVLYGRWRFIRCTFLHPRCSRDESHRCGLDQICHLSVGKKYLTNSMRLYTARSSDSGLRPPSLKEAQSADEEFWSEAFRPVNEEPDDWTMESAVSEVLEVKNFLWAPTWCNAPEHLRAKRQEKGSFLIPKVKVRGRKSETWMGQIPFC